MKILYTILVFALCINAKAQFIATIAGNGTTGYTGDGELSVSARLRDPYKICLDAAGNIYFSDCSNHCIRKINTNGIITTLAGTGTPGYSGDGGPASSAKLNYPYGVYVDAGGNLYIADIANACIRKVDINGIITTIAGSGTQGYSGDGGLATSAELNGPSGVIADAFGNVFIMDSENHRIRKVDANGIITTIAGTGTQGFGGDGGQATSADLYRPCDLTIDLTGDLLFADSGNNRVRKISTNGIITTIAGNGTATYSGDGGPALNAGVDTPVDVDLDGLGNTYITEQFSHCIRKIDANGIITTIAGSGAPGYGGDGGLATAAIFKGVSGMAYRNNKIYIADYLNQRIRMICSSPVSVSLSASDTIVCVGNSTTLTANGANTYTYTWGPSQTGTNNIGVSPSNPITTYYVQGVDVNGCVGSSSITLFASPCLGAEELSNTDQVKIYPNPVSQKLTVETRFTSGTFVLFSTLGQEILKKEMNETKQSFDLESLPNGVYFIRVESGGKKLLEKIIKQ